MLLLLVLSTGKMSEAPVHTSMNSAGFSKNGAALPAVKLVYAADKAGTTRKRIMPILDLRPPGNSMNVDPAEPSAYGYVPLMNLLLIRAVSQTVTPAVVATLVAPIVLVTLALIEWRIISVAVAALAVGVGIISVGIKGPAGAYMPIRVTERSECNTRFASLPLPHARRLFACAKVPGSADIEVKRLISLCTPTTSARRYPGTPAFRPPFATLARGLG